MTEPVEYPSHWETHAVLKDGSTVEIRPIRTSDRDALEAFHGRQSRESIYFRYFRYRPELSDKELDHFTTVDYRDRMAFVALLGSTLVAVARYEKWRDKPTAEVAFFVDDDHHGLGLGTLMLEFLAAAGRDRGLAGFTASVLAENYRMLAVFRSAGFEVSTRFADGAIEVDIGIEVTEEATSAIADRQRLSTARSVARIIEPQTVAVIGASRTPGKVGYELVRNLARHLSGRDDGVPLAERLYPVNPTATEAIVGLAPHRSIADATEALAAAVDARGGQDNEAEERPGAGRTIDLAVIAVRAEQVAEVVAQCATAGVQGLLVVSAGFAESDDAGVARERDLVDLARDNGMRLIGPNAFGLINTDPDVALTAVFHPIPIVAGRVAVASQSGPLGTAVVEQMRRTGIGISSFVGVGNRADVSVNDLLDYWEQDQRSHAILLYVENYGNLRNFSAVAARTSRSKPIITIGPGSPDLVELLNQAGVIVVDQVSQLTEQALLAATQPPAKGNRVVVVSNAASLARLTTDACRRHGLEVVVPSSVGGVSAADSVLIGDLDSVTLLPSGDPADYERIVVAAAVSAEVDLILVALAPTAYLLPDRLGRMLDRLNRSIDKPMAALGLVEPDRLGVEGLPLFTFPEEAAQALGRHARHGRWRSANREPIEAVEPAAALDPLIDELLADEDEVTVTMADPALPRLLSLLDLPIAPFGLASDRDGIEREAERLGYPVVLKAANLVPRSIGESGGAAIDLHNPTGLLAAYERMVEQLGSAMDPAVVQRMVPSGPLVRLTLAQDPNFGSMVSIGAGGSGMERLAPMARRFLPFDRRTADELASVTADEGLVPDDDRAGLAALGALVTGLAGAAAMADRVASVTLNPILVAGEQTAPTDIEIVLRRRPVDVLAGLRHLR
ncbi:MAG: GNAT family N-acetyltransferase [Actinomycetota bacterium]